MFVLYNTREIVLKGGIILIKVGVKITPSVKEGYIKKIEKFADYFEIYADLDVKYGDRCLSELSLPVSVVHTAHLGEGVNFLNSSREKVNIQALENALELADYFGSEKIVFHPEEMENEFCSVDNLIGFLENNYDNRLLIENMPYSSEGVEHFGRNCYEIRRIISVTAIGFCLDFTHACEYGAKMCLDSGKLIQELLSLNPKHFHLADTDLNKVFEPAYNETHLNLGSGNMDIRTIKKFIPNNSDVTLETPQNMEKQIWEIKYLKKWH